MVGVADPDRIALPALGKNADKVRDPEMHQARKGNQWYFGEKAHIGVGEFSGLVHHVECTRLMSTMSPLPTCCYMARKTAQTLALFALPNGWSVGGHCRHRGQSVPRRPKRTLSTEEHGNSVRMMAPGDSVTRNPKLSGHCSDDP